ncbi:MAG: Dna2/Cas4 domain-containing protein [Candidatus Thermoplasmatota archaeon]
MGHEEREADVAEEERVFPGVLSSARITGVMDSCCSGCRRKLWLFAHHIALESEHENVATGRYMHEKYIRSNQTLEGV